MKVLNLTATGCMGSGLVKALKNDPDHHIYAFTRTPESDAAQALKSEGITIFKGSFSDKESLDKAFSEGFDSVFFTIFPDLAGGNEDLVQAENIIDAAKRHGVKQIIYGSVARTGTQENFDRVYKDLPENSFFKTYWQKKWAIDQKVRDSGLSWVIIKPPTFIQNVVLPRYVAFAYPELVSNHALKTTVDPDFQQWYVDGSDVGKFAAAAIRDPAKFHQKDIAFGTELINPRQLVEKLSKASGKNVKLHEWTPEELEESKTHMFRSVGYILTEMGTDPDLGGFEVEGIGALTPIDEWLENNKEGTWLA